MPRRRPGEPACRIPGPRIQDVAVDPPVGPKGLPEAAGRGQRFVLRAGAEPALELAAGPPMTTGHPSSTWRCSQAYMLLPAAETSALSMPLLLAAPRSSDRPRSPLPIPPGSSSTPGPREPDRAMRRIEQDVRVSDSGSGPPGPRHRRTQAGRSRRGNPMPSSMGRP